ncbi:MAG: membrane-binding protein, partial [Candidatus Aminicenantes bacterium]|nr:membrane-binding protein [Candidatus Aminicenantes bacterium]
LHRIFYTLAKELDEQRKIAENLNVQQEKLKADLKSKTDALNIEMIKLNSLFSRGKKLVKIQIPSVQWKEFGIADKK